MTILIGVLVVALITLLFYGLIKLISYITKVKDLLFITILTLVGSGVLFLLIVLLHLVGNFVMNIFLK
jgi:hypothetical protein